MASPHCDKPCALLAAGTRNAELAAWSTRNGSGGAHQVHNLAGGDPEPAAVRYQAGNAGAAVCCNARTAGALLHARMTRARNSAAPRGPRSTQRAPACDEQRGHAGDQQAREPAAGGRGALVWRWPHARAAVSMQAMRHLLAAGLANRSSEAPGAVLQKAATAAAVGLQRSQVGLVSAALLRPSECLRLRPCTLQRT